MDDPKMNDPTMDEPTMSLLSLPDELMLPILKELRWRDLNNFKLVCRKFYLTIVKNIEKLDRPRVEHLKIFYDENKIFGADYSSMYFEIIEGHMVPHHVEFSNDREYEDFLKDKDFTQIKNLVFENITNGEIICVTNTYDILRGGHCEYFSLISLSDTTSELLEITISNTKEFRIPYNGVLLKKESFKKMGLFERGRSQLFIKKIMMDILTGDPMLEYETTLGDTSEPIYIQIIHQLFKIGFFDLKKRCDIGRFSFHIHWNGGPAVLGEDFYRDLYEKIRLNNGSVEDVDFGLDDDLVFMRCSKCGYNHTNMVYYDESVKHIEICLR
uniref:F-box domain-containing protein n=1 Tax=Strongyloides papillosus TaxID=174720 RepID=A0A0N5BI55_STREA